MACVTGGREEGCSIARTVRCVSPNEKKAFLAKGRRWWLRQRVVLPMTTMQVRKEDEGCVKYGGGRGRGGGHGDDISSRLEHMPVQD
jgi:hypothetical protein